jgi:two-component system sensor histidine kinase NblS
MEEKHHSRVHLVSEVGVGTTFWFDLNVFVEKKTVVDQLISVDTPSTTQTSSAAASLL